MDASPMSGSGSSPLSPSPNPNSNSGGGELTATSSSVPRSTLSREKARYVAPLADIRRPATMSLVALGGGGRRPGGGGGGTLLPLLGSDSARAAAAAQDYYSTFYSHVETLRLAPTLGGGGTSGSGSGSGSGSASAATAAAAASKANAAAILAVETTLYKQNTIQCVDFCGRSLGAPVVEALARLLEYKRTHGVRHSLQVLILDGNGSRVGPRGAVPLLRAVAADSVLTTLHLEDIDMQDPGALVLAALLERNTTVTHVNVAKNGIGEDGVTAISAALAKNMTLQFLGLSLNPVRDPGAEALGGALKVNRSLRSLELVECRLGDAGLLALGVGLAIEGARLLTLHVARNHVSEDGLDAFAELLQRNVSLSTLRYTHCDHVSSLKLRAVIRRNRRLKQESEPRNLEKVVIRLYHQQYKLQQAQQTLKEHQKLNVDLEDSAAKTEMEFNGIKQDVLRRMKEVSTNIGFTTNAIVELKTKRETMRADYEKLQKDSEDAALTLKEQYAEVGKTSAANEQELEKVSQLLDQLKGHDESRRDDFTAKIQAARDDTGTLQAQLRELSAKVEDVQAQIQVALQQQQQAKK